MFATAGFAAVSGASVATAAVLGMAIPEMLEAGIINNSQPVLLRQGALASLIPPSAILVIYAIIVEQDVGKLLSWIYSGAVSTIVYGTLIVCIAVI